MHFTLKQNPLRYEDLEDFIAAYRPEDRSKRVESERFQPFTYDELHRSATRSSLDLIWLRDESLEDSDEPAAARRASPQEIVEDLEAALSEFAQIAESLRAEPT